MILSYLYDYVKFNNISLYALLALGFLSVVKYFKEPPQISTGWAVALAIGVGLALRIAWVLFSSHAPRMSWESATQPVENELINLHAIDITKGIWFINPDGTPSARRPIGYPVFLGVLYKIFGVHLWIAWLSNLVLYGVTAVFIFLIARRILSTGNALTATWFFALYPISVYASKLITDEHLFLPVWYAGIYLLLREIQDEYPRPWWPWYSLLFGYATMIRTHTIFMPIVVGLALLWRKKPWPKVLTRVFLVALVMQLPNLPWIIRNYRIWKVPVIYTTNGQCIYQEFNSSSKPEGGGWIPKRGEPDFSEEMERAEKSGNEGLVQKYANQALLRWIVRHPGEAFNLAVPRFLYFMNWNRQGGVWPIWYQYYENVFDPRRPLSDSMREFLEETAFTFYYLLLFTFLISVGMICSRWKSFPREKRIGMLILAVSFLFWCAEQLVIHPERKYRYPLEPWMMMAASVFLNFILYDLRWEHAWTGIRARFRRPAV